jgi:hypothetical protein
MTEGGISGHGPVSYSTVYTTDVVIYSEHKETVAYGHVNVVQVVLHCS